MVERLSNTGENNPTCRRLRDAIKEATGQRLIDRGFPPEMISRFSHVVLFFNDDGGRQATFTLPGQASSRPSSLNVGFDVTWDTPDGSSDTHYYLSEEGLVLQTGDYFKDPHLLLSEDASEDLASKLLEPETTISVTLISGYQG